MVFVMTPPANASYGTSHAARAPRTTASFTAMSPERVAQNLHLDVLDVHVQVVAGQRLRLRVAREAKARRRHAEKAGGGDDADDAREDEDAAAALGCRGDGEGGEHSGEREQPAGAATKRLDLEKSMRSSVAPGSGAVYG